MKQQLIALALSTALLAGSAAAIAPEEAFPAVNTYPGFADAVSYTHLTLPTTERV